MKKFRKLDESANELVAEKMREYISIYIDDKAFPDPNDIKFDHFYDIVSKRLYASLRLNLVKRKVHEEVRHNFAYPKTLWDHFKYSIKSRLPKWLGKHITVVVVYIPTHVDVYHSCPHIGASWKGDHIEWLMRDEEKES